MTKQEARVTALRSQAILIVLKWMEEHGKLDQGDVMHCGGSIMVPVRGIGKMRISIDAQVQE
jgi:hypothetical protein